MRACAAPRRIDMQGGESGTWISPLMVAAYTRLFDAGYAHSVETWHDDVLVGGLYGVAIGRMFYGESMFSANPMRQKSHCAAGRQLQHWEFGLIDCQMETAHLASLGARTMRARIRSAAAELVKCRIVRPWTFNL